MPTYRTQLHSFFAEMVTISAAVRCLGVAVSKRLVNASLAPPEAFFSGFLVLYHGKGFPVWEDGGGACERRVCKPPCANQLTEFHRRLSPRHEGDFLVCFNSSEQQITPALYYKELGELKAPRRLCGKGSPGRQMEGQKFYELSSIRILRGATIGGAGQKERRRQPQNPTWALQKSVSTGTGV